MQEMQTPSIFALMQIKFPELGPAERKALRAILTMPSTKPLSTIADLSDFTDVSAPTILRAASKLGYANYDSFREKILQDRDERGVSALSQMSTQDESLSENEISTNMQDWFPKSIDQTFSASQNVEIERAMALLSDLSRHLVFTGGRFSHFLAGIFFSHADLVRPGCRLLHYDSLGRANQIADFRRSHVLVIYDFRRYQTSSIELAREAKSRRAKVILISDQWMSPIADLADAILIGKVRSPSPFDSLVPALAMTEVLIARLYATGTIEAKARIEMFERLSGNSEFSRAGDGDA